jgi:hypothetical protein
LVTLADRDNKRLHGICANDSPVDVIILRMIEVGDRDFAGYVTTTR